MRSSLLISTAAFAGMLHGTTASAAVFYRTTAPSAVSYIPNNVRVVQKSDTGGRIYSTIRGAISSITNASATNPYVVMVMPGVYRESVRMKPFVDLVGSGPDNTLIQSSTLDPNGSCTVGTVVMANNSSIKDIKIKNSAPGNGLVFYDASAKAEGVSVEVGSDEATDDSNANGICTYGAYADAILNNVDVRAHNGLGQTNAIQTMGGRLTLVNSKLFTTHGAVMNYCNVICDGSPAESPSTIRVVNSSLESSCSAANGFHSGANEATILNSSITLVNATAYAIGFQSEGNMTMVDTRIFVSGSVPFYERSAASPGATLNVANSQLPGDRSALIVPGVTLVGNVDENFRPIQNHQRVPPP